MEEQEAHPFYGTDIYRHSEQDFIRAILEKYKDEAVTEELKKKIWDDLQWEKHLGNIKIPFKVAIRRDASGKYPDVIEVILDTKV